MKKFEEHKNIFEVVQKERSSPRAQARAKKNVPSDQIAVSTPIFSLDDTSWQGDVRRMQNELDALKEQLRLIEKESGISLSQVFAIPEFLNEEEKRLYRTHVKQREESLEKLIVIPQLCPPKEVRQAREEKRERMVRTVGKRKQWISL